MASVGDSNCKLLKDINNTPSHDHKEHKIAVENSLSLLDLNDDCLELICNFLIIFDQMRVQQVCVRLSHIIKAIWARKHNKIVLDKNLLRKCSESKRDNDLYDYLQLNSESVENLKFDSIHSEQLEKLKTLRFPKVKTLYMDLSVDDYPNDKYTMQLVDMFPAVETLTFQSCITGIYLWKFENVTDLNVDCCEFLETTYFERIFTTLKLRRLSILFYGYNTNFEEPIMSITKCNLLEELIIDDHHLFHLMGQLSDMPKFRRVAFYTRDYDDYLMEKLADTYGPLMRKVVYNDAFWGKSDHLDSLLKMKNLESLILIEDDFELEHIEQVANKLTNLRELRFIQTRMDNLDDGILSVVENCTHLEILDVSKSKVSNEFLERLNCAVQKQKKRSTPLKFYCYDTQVAEHFTTELPLADQLRVYVKEQMYDTLGNRFIDCSWQPNN